MVLTTAKLKDFVFYLSLFSLISLWYIPHTIAARYACEALLLILVLFYTLNWKPILHRSKLILVFILYLFVQIFILSDDLKISLFSFKSEWMHFILFSIAGVGSGLFLARKQVSNILLYLGFAFSVPILIHLTLFAIKGFSSGSIPWGYWGLSDIHGDLAYSSLQAVIFVSVFLLCQAKQSFIKLKHIVFAFLFLVPIGLITVFGTHYDPEKWLESPIRALSAFKSDPFLGLCSTPNAVAFNDQSEIQATLNSEQIEARSRVMHGDSARIILAKAGFELSKIYPLGFNGSKKSYQQAIVKYCGKLPFVEYSHAHNAWLDTALAIGIPGAFLLLLVMLNYGWQGFQMIKQHNQINPFALALFVSASIWILRGVLDSTLRDQMLEMQAFILAFLLAAAINYQPKISDAK